MKDPKKLLETIKKQKKEINELLEQGQTEKVHEIKQDLAWQKAFDKTEGKKVFKFFIVKLAEVNFSFSFFVSRLKTIQHFYAKQFVIRK